MALSILLTLAHGELRAFSQIGFIEFMIAPWVEAVVGFGDL